MTMYMFSLSGTTADGVMSAGIEMRADGDISALSLGAGVDALASTIPFVSESRAELSFSPQTNWSRHDGRDSLFAVESQVYHGNGSVADDRGQLREVQNLSSLAIPVRAGQRLWLHLQGFGTGARVSAIGWLHVVDGHDERVLR